MKLKKTIEILNLLFSRLYEGSDLDRDKALKLGIEALKRRKYQSEQTSKWADIKLPGKTEEEE